MTGFVVRYLWRTSPHFAHSLLMATALGLFGVWMVGALAEDGGAPYVLILFGQLFASSSGFRPVADAGRFDALLVRGASRRRLAVTHWLLSAAPGICAWCAVWGAELWWCGDSGPVGATLRGLLALLLVSTVAWVVTLPTARLLGGVAWAITLGLLAASPRGVGWLSDAVTTPAIDGVRGFGMAVLALVVCRFLLLFPGAERVASHPAVLLGVLVVASGALAVGVCWIERRDFRGAM